MVSVVRRHRRVRDWQGELVIYRGLSVVVKGIDESFGDLEIDRDEDRKVAWVVARAVDEQFPTPSDYDDINQAAVLLAQRARRVLGKDWCVLDWSPPHAPAAG